MTTGTADSATHARDTFPKLLAERARTAPDRPAYREKEYGIWQTHGWGHVADQVRLFAAGLAELGFRRGDRLIVVGDNRPLLYWSMCAAQSLGASRMRIFTSVVLPGALPSICAGLAIGMGVSWFSLLAGEIISGQYGTTATPWATHQGKRSRSISRCNRL